MYNYIFNNRKMIDCLQKLYDDGISIDKLLQTLHSGEMCNNFNAIDFARFQVFLDSCLLLNNKERLAEFFNWENDEYSFKKYVEKAKSNEILFSDFQECKSHGRIPLSVPFQLFYSCSERGFKLHTQVNIIRNSFAHMQIGNFLFERHEDYNSYLLGFNVYDKGNKVMGFVVWSTIHEFICRFFSNYNQIRFYDAFFFGGLYSNKKKSLLRFYKLKHKGPLAVPLDGYNGSPIKTLIDLREKDQHLFFEFIEKNWEGFEIEEVNLVSEIGLLRTVLLTINENKEHLEDLRVRFAPDYEISNFLVHIIQLTGVFYSQCLSDKKYSNTRTEFLENQILELREDTAKNLMFKLGFIVLKTFNLAFRLENKDWPGIEFDEVDISKFDYEPEDYNKYEPTGCVKNKVKNEKIFILEKVRNAVCHGHIAFERINNSHYFVFKDYRVVIKIKATDLDCFLDQECLYQNIPEETPFLAISV